jgi:hypothetical protein
MSIQQLKLQHPDLFRQVYVRGVRAEKRRQQEARRQARLKEAVELLVTRIQTGEID